MIEKSKGISAALSDAKSKLQPSQRTHLKDNQRYAAIQVAYIPSSSEEEDENCSSDDSEGKKSSDSFTKDYFIPTKVYLIERKLNELELELEKKA
jgi:hypothetical protein